MKLHTATSFIDVTEAHFIFKLEISNGVYGNSGDVKIVVCQEDINLFRGAVLLLAGGIANGDSSFTDIDYCADCHSVGSWKGNYTVWDGIAFVMAAFDKIRHVNHDNTGCLAGIDCNLLFRLPDRLQIEWIMPNIFPRSSIYGSVLFDSELQLSQWRGNYNV